jgi:hypothetical protein
MPTPAGRAAARWRGRPVPWVARWSGERIDPALYLTWTRQGRLAYHDERVTDRAFGVLWYRNRDGRCGTPEFGEIHTGRHLSCMTTPLCQVCGNRTREESGRIGWLVDADEWALLADPTKPTTTITPPTCRPCWPLATRACPHLRATGTTRFTVAVASPVAVYGDLCVPGSHAVRATDIVMPLTLPNRCQVLGKQLVVELGDIRPEPDTS